ncbi:MAG: methyltransferase domain-containing protein [Anaerolineales bacterium]|nr:methyltransferase domain-containing protein [Anaerolineales bacterium]
MTEQHDAPQIFDLDYYQRLHAIEEQHGWAQGLRDAMDALLQPALNGRRLRVLDVGCGTGFLLGYLQRYQLDGEVVGIDISSYALQFCRQRGAHALAIASASQLPFHSDSFDLIICIDTIQHLTPAGADLTAIREFARLLRPGGLLYLRTNSARGHRPLEGADPDQYRRYYLSELAKMVEQTGLETMRATYLNAIPGFWAMLREYAQAGHHKVRAIGPGLSIKPYPPEKAWLNRAIYRVLAFEAWLIGKVGVNLPFGHSTAVVSRKG